MAQDAAMRAMTNRSIRTIKAELEFLADSSLISSQQLNNFLSQLPSESTSRAIPDILAQPIPAPVSISTPLSNLNLNLNEKQSFYAPIPQSIPPEPTPRQSPLPSYHAQPPAGPPPLIYCTALYNYTGDAGDLSLMEKDRVAVLEYMNDDWWRGRNERTGQEGIFPRSYVREAAQDQQRQASGMFSPPPQKLQQSAYAGNMNMPIGVAQGQQLAPAPQMPGRTESNMRKFGSKLGNAAIFGAGATIGSDIVNSIF